MIICVISVICVLFLLERGWCGFEGFIRIRHFYANLRVSEWVNRSHRLTTKRAGGLSGHTSWLPVTWPDRKTAIKPTVRMQYIVCEYAIVSATRFLRLLKTEMNTSCLWKNAYWMFCKLLKIRPVSKKSACHDFTLESRLST